MGMFDDLVPGQQAQPDAAGGLFDDLIPASPAAAPTAVDNKKYPYSADNPPDGDNAFVKERKIVNGKEYRLHQPTGAIYGPDDKATDDPDVMAAFGKTKLSKRAQARADINKPQPDFSPTSILDNAISSIPGIGQQYGAAKWAIQTGKEIADTPQETTDALANAAQQPDQSSMATDWQAGTNNAKTAYLGQQIIGLRTELSNLTRTANERPDDPLIQQRLARTKDAYQRAFQMYDEASGQQFPQNPAFAALHDNSIPGTAAQKTAAALRADPWGVARTLTLQSGPVSIPSVAGGIIGSIAAGRAGAALGAGVPSAYIEAGLNLRDQIAARGADMNDPASRRATFEKYADEIIRDAQISGLIVGAGDAAGAAFGSGVAALKGEGTGNLVGKELVGTIADALFGAAGEGGKQVYNTGEISDPQSLIDEGLGEVVAGGVQQGGMMAVEGLKSASGKTDRQAPPPKGQRIEPRLFDDLVPQPQPQNNGGTIQTPETNLPPAAAMADTDILRQTGYSFEQIADMNPAERAQAAQEARQQGVQPIGTIAPDAPAVGTSAPAPGFGTRKQRAPGQPDMSAPVQPVQTPQAEATQQINVNNWVGNGINRVPPVDSVQPVNPIREENSPRIVRPADSVQPPGLTVPPRQAPAQGPIVDNSAADKAFDSFMASRKPITQEAFAAASGLDLKEAGRAIQRAALAGRVIQGRNGNWRRPPTRSTPIDVLDFIASIGGIQDVTGELAGMNLPKIGPFGPAVRKNGLHPDKVREALVEAGYLRDAGRDTGGQAQTTVDDVYQLLDAHMRGRKTYSTPQDQAAADAIDVTKKNENANPDYAPVHPIAQRFGIETWAKLQAFFTDFGSYEEAWSLGEIADAARLVSEGWNADDAFERAAFLHVDAIADPEQDMDPELTRKFAGNQDLATAALDHPPFPDTETPDAVQQPGPQEAGAGVRPAGNEDGNTVGQAEDAGPAAQVPDIGEGGSEAGSAVSEEVGSPPSWVPTVGTIVTLRPQGTKGKGSRYRITEYKRFGEGPEDWVFKAVDSNGRPAMTDGISTLRPTTETGADNLPQTVIPGAEAVSEADAAKAAKAEKARKELEARRKQSKLRKSGQESVEDQDGGLFGGKGPKQSSLLDAPEPQPETQAAFDAEKWNKDRADRIAASRAAGKTHLDKIEPAVETMRGLAIYNVHDPKERGVIRTVANTGEVVIHWSDAYSAKKNLATEKFERRGKRAVEVYESWLGPRDLKDYVADGMAARDNPSLSRKPKSATPSDATSQTEQPEAKPNSGSDKPNSVSYGTANTLVTADRAAELRAKLKAKLKGQLNAGIDPEMLAIGTELAAFHIEAGARQFVNFARAIAADLDTSIKAIRPYLRSWYNGARDMMEDAGLDVTGMDTPDQVRAALADLDKESLDDAGSRIGNVGQEGIEPDQPGLAAGQPGGEGVDPALAPEPPADGGPPSKPGSPRPPRTRPASQDGGKPAPEPSSGVAGTGRAGAGSEGLADDGAGGGRGPDQPEPISLRPNYYIADPEQLIGGTPKVRFSKNRKAIEAYRALEEEARDPTPEELDAMASYIGWGSFGQELFQGTWEYPRPKDSWEKEDKWLRDHLGKDEWESAQRSIINAHYTDPPTVTAMWDMVQRMGFHGGRILEPSMGIGNFFGLMPRTIMDKSDLTGIELDSLTGGMAKHLYPRANIQIKGYQDSKTPDNFYDLVIGNWPFAADGPSDRRYDKLSPTLHDYFFIKALDQVRPGGLVIGITSSGSMDKVGRSARAAMDDRADLVASFRLPSGAFEKYAGTSVVTDIIILKKREPKAERNADAKWMDTKEISVNGGQIKTNEYWLERPDNVLGRMGYGHGTIRGRPGMIVERLADFANRLKALPERLPENIYQPIKRGKEPRFVTNNTKDREGSIIDQGGNFFVVQGERLARLDDLTPAFNIKDTAKAAARKDQVGRLIKLRRAYGALIDAERDSSPNVEDLRTDLRKEYEAFRKKHGTVKDSDGLSIFDKIQDPAAPALAALETPQGKPSRILSESTTRQRKKLDKPTVKDAFVLARNEGLTLNLERVAELSGQPIDAVARDLLESKAIYKTPGGGYEVSDIYLSGNVRRKLRELLDAKERGEDVEASIDAIKSVIPKDVPYFQIEAKLGATWVPNEYYSQFVSELLGVGEKGKASINVRFKAGAWSVWFTDNRFNDRPEATTTWGHVSYPFSKLVRAAMNNQTITIRTKDANGDVVVDQGATQEVNNKASRIREEFTAWAWRESDRKVFFERQYNDVMNAIATPKYDGSFLDFSGMALHRGEDSFSLRSHQVNAIWRGIANRRGLYAHEVGTGKTYTMGGIAVESRRYGIARKPLLIAHNANSATVAKEIQEMYPGASVLYISTLGKEDMHVTMRRIANEDWDVIVIPHSLIDRMALSEKTLMDIAAEDIRAMEEEAIAAAKEDGIELDPLMMDNEDAMKKVRSTTAKQLVHQRNKIIKSIKDMANRASKEGAVFFEELGIDMILVDEVHEFKKPPLATRMKMKGLNTQTSNRSIALRFLTDYVKRLNGGNGVHIFSGTPITNTLTEIYNMMRYAMDKDMEVDGIKDWDPWFNTFADASTDVELSATGEYEPVTRLAAFVNVAELRRMAGSVMDIVFADDMPEFVPRRTAAGKTMADKDLSEADRQHLINGRTENPVGRPYKKMLIDTGPMGAEQQTILEHLIDLSRQFKNGDGKTRRDWLMKGDERVPIRVETSAANAGLDPRLYDMGAKDEPTSKVNRAVTNLMRHYNEHEKSTQVIFMERGFSDSSTKSAGTDDKGRKLTVKVARFNLVNDLIAKLEKAGVPRKQIAVVDGSTSKEKRKEIADKMNKAEIRVVIGNTKTLGVGVNMQSNLRAMHHLDAPWTPGELEQRNGRGWRQGNKWNTVIEYRYITEKLDGRRWQVLAVKDRFIKAFMKADENVRVIDGDAVSTDESESADDLAKTLSEAAGDPRILQLNKFQNDVNKLENRERLHTYGVADAGSKIKDLRADIARNISAADRVEDDVAHLETTADNEFSAVVDGTTYTKRAEANEALETAALIVPVKRGPQTLGLYRGFKILVERTFEYSGGSFYVERRGAYAIKPSFSSIDSILRGLKEKAAKYRDNSEIEASIERMDAMSKMPFAQQQQLDAKKKALNDLRNDLELNPVPPPSWLRHGAPIDTLIYVDGKPRPVTGHKWNKDGYFVITDEGLVPYRDARTDSGDFVFEEKEFTVPVDKTAAYSEMSPEAIKQGWEAKEINGEWHVIAPGGYSAAKGPTKAQAIMAFNMDPNYSYLKNKTERQASKPLSSIQAPRSLQRPNKFRYAISDKQRRAVVADVQQAAQRILGHHLQKVVTALDLAPLGFSSDEDGVFDPNTGAIYVALQGAQDPRTTLRHEAIHALRQAGVFTKPEWAALSRMAKSQWIDQYGIRGRYEALYRERFDITEAQLEELLIEEAVADAFADYMDNPVGEGVIARIFEKLRQFLESVRSMLKGQGFTKPDQVFSNVDRGRMGKRAAGTGTSREFMLYGRQDSLAPLSSRGRQAPPRNPAQGSFEAPHDERVRKALFDSTDTLLSRIRRAAQAGGVEFRRKVQDREIDLLRTQSAITQAAGPIAEPQDAYLAASLYPGRVAQRDRDLVTDVIEPLVEDIAKRGLTLDEVDQFNRARHAFERNLEIGKLYKPGQQFHDAMFNPSIVGGSGMSDDQASDILNAAQQSGKYADLEAIGDKIVSLNAKTLDKLLAEGLIEQDYYDTLKKKYRYYVPLRGHEESADDTHPDSPRTGSRYDIRGKEFQQAYGRTSAADSTLAYSILQARQAIIRIEKNRVGKRFLRLAQANPNEAFWQVNRRDMKKVIDKNTGLVRNVYDPGTTQAENVYAVKVGGKAYHVTIHHEGLLKAMKGIGAENMHGAVVAFYKINRFLAGMNTSYDPEFIFRNLLRDLQQTGIVLQEERIKGLTRNVVMSMPKAAAGMNAMLRGDTNTEWSRYAREYADAGGKMGFMGRNDIESEKASLEKLMKEQNPSASLKAWMVLRDEVAGRLDRYNDSIENTLRLATYVHMRKAGISKDKAAFAARELTVNFNRKGEWSSGINAFYMFFNAAMQGGASMAMRLARSKTVRRVAYGIMVTAFLQDMLNRMLAGDDDDGENRYDKIPDEIKAKNGIIMFPKWAEEKYGVPYLKWPLPLGYNMFHIAGTQAGHAVAGSRTPLEAAGETVGAIADAFNPLGGGGTILNFFAPTILDPAADIATNTDYFGENIMPRSYDDTQPNSDRYKPNVNPAAKFITDFLNEATGGSPERKGAVDWSPEWVEHIWDFAAGGVGRLVSRTSTVADTLIKGDDLDANKVPFARVFTGQSNKFTDRDTYNEIKDAVHVTEKEIEARRAEGNTQEAERVAKKYAREVRMIEIMKTAEKQMTKLRKDYRAMKAMQGIGDAQRKERLDEISRRMDAIQLNVRQRWNSPAMTSTP